MATVSLPAGWYPDPDEGGQNRLRWFDGDDWTEQTAPGMTPYEQQSLALAQRAAHRGDRTKEMVAALFFLIVAIATAIPGLWLLTVIFGLLCAGALWRAL